MYGPEWKDKVSPEPKPSPSDSSSASQSTTDGLLTYPAPTQAASDATNQPHPPQSNINGATQSIPTHDIIGGASAPQPSPAQDVASGTSATAHPSPVTKSSTVDPSERFSQCKDQGNSLVKQVKCGWHRGIVYTNTV